MNIILIGYRGCGKTLIGEMLAQTLGYEFIDCDLMLVNQTQISIATFVGIHGWDAFRRQETEILRKLVQKDNLVIATGGGIILSSEARELLKNEPCVIWLTASENNIIDRIRTDENSKSMRPALGDYESLAHEVRATLKERLPLYEDCSLHAVNTDWCTVEQAVEEIRRLWRLTSDEI